MWYVSVAGTFKLEVTHGWVLEEHKYRKGAGPSFADLSTPEAEQTDVFDDLTLPPVYFHED